MGEFYDWLERMWLIFNKSCSYESTVSSLFYINTHSWKILHSAVAGNRPSYMLKTGSIVYSNVDEDNADIKLTFKAH